MSSNRLSSGMWYRYLYSPLDFQRRPNGHLYKYKSRRLKSSCLGGSSGPPGKEITIGCGLYVFCVPSGKVGVCLPWYSDLKPKHWEIGASNWLKPLTTYF